jgi:hypothetical protein
MTRTPPKRAGPKSSKEFDSKSQRYSIDEAQNKPKKSTKGQGFNRKIQLFMDKPENDGELDEKVKRKLIEIKQEISMGNR